MLSNLKAISYLSDRKPLARIKTLSSHDGEAAKQRRTGCWYTTLLGRGNSREMQTVHQPFAEGDSSSH